MATLLEQTKVSLRLRTQDGGIVDQIKMLIMAGIADLQSSAGVIVGNVTSPDVDLSEATLADLLVAQAVVTYVMLHFGEPDNPDRLQASYDMQKAQLRTIAFGGAEDGQDS